MRPETGSGSTEWLTNSRAQEAVRRLNQLLTTDEAMVQVQVDLPGKRMIAVTEKGMHLSGASLEAIEALKEDLAVTVAAGRRSSNDLRLVLERLLDEANSEPSLTKGLGLRIDHLTGHVVVSGPKAVAEALRHRAGVDPALVAIHEAEPIVPLTASPSG